MPKTIEFVLPITPPLVPRLGARHSLPNSLDPVKISHDRRSLKYQNDNRRDTMMTDAWSDQFNTSNELFNQSMQHRSKILKNTSPYRYRWICLRILLPLICSFIILGGILTAILVPVLNMSKTTITTAATPTTNIVIISTSIMTTFSTTSTSESTTTTTTTSFTTSTTESTTTLTTATTTTTTTKICLSDLILLTYTNETIYGLWKTIAGGNGTLSTAGSNAGNYWPTEIPQYVFDRNTGTKYTNFGSCNSGSFTLACGTNSGLYITPNRGVSLLLAIQFRVGNDNPERDPLTVTIEGSNQTASALMLGSSWSLIYNGSTGLSSDPGRYTDGIIQYIPTNVIWYTSYRFLFTSKRNSASSVQVGEITMLGY